MREVHKTTLVEQVMNQIKSLIASDEYKPGDKIPTEQELAETFDVGRSSIREAIKIFNYLGVLKSIAGKGTFIQERSKISKEALTWSLLLGHDELDQMVDLRGSLELWSIFNLSGIMKNDLEKAKEIRQNLQQIIENMKEGVKNNDRLALIEADFQFHQIIIQGCGNDIINSLFDTLRAFMYDEIRRSQLDYVDLSKIPAEHTVLLQDLISGDIGQIRMSFTEHLENTKFRIKNPGSKNRG